MRRAPLNLMRSRFTYDKATGVIRHKIDVYSGKGGRKLEARAGDRAGWIGGNGGNGDYRYVSVNGKSHRAVRVIWLLVTGKWPKHKIDHWNGKTTDDRWDNLRHATSAQNCQNKKTHSNNRLGIAGVRRHNGGKFEVRVSALFISKTAAVAARKRASEALHGQFALTRRPSPGVTHGR